MKMHADEVDVDDRLVRCLVAGQFPQWAQLPVERLDSSGTVNALYRLGGDMIVRLPRTDWAVGSVDKELRWLPRLAALPSVEIPVPLAKGVPAEGYPWDWGIYPWLEGDHPAAGRSDTLARQLARFIRALRAVDEPAGPPGRGATPLTRYDSATRAALADLAGAIDSDAAAAAWDDALRAPAWNRPPVWTHGDLMPANLLVRDGSLTAVLDWECVGLGDPACDLAVAWNLLSATGRDDFRSELDVDDATWERAGGWALWTGLVALPYYRITNPPLAENARYRVAEVLADRATSG